MVVIEELEEWKQRMETLKEKENFEAEVTNAANRHFVHTFCDHISAHDSKRYNKRHLTNELFFSYFRIVFELSCIRAVEILIF